MSPFGLADKILIGVAAVALLIGIYYGWEKYQQSKGAAIEHARQEKENAQFVVKSQKGAVSFDTCDSAGGLYQFESGSCKLP